ncbi:MAG: 5'-methylthioadenosine nucleosidase [Desulfobulbaceae bacterium]|nr:5'-methylthioadenosine nucleosidase [Desulfobulbaceae bacterium]
MKKQCRYIIVAALELETPGLKQFAPVIHTGVGKINAAIKLYEALLSYRPDLVINYGTAGAVDGSQGLLKVDTFVQWDIDVRALDIPRGVTPYSGEDLPEARGIVLASGDSFVTDAKAQLEGLNIAVNLIDMEAYALHKVCQHQHTAFDCYKYITDNSDSNSSTDWLENVAKGAGLLSDTLKREYGPSLLLSS